MPTPITFDSSNIANVVPPSSFGYARAIGDPDYNFGTSDFTIEFWVNPISTANISTIFEVTNNEPISNFGYNKTRFIATINSGILQVTGLQNYRNFYYDSVLAPYELALGDSNTQIFSNGIQLDSSQYLLSGNSFEITSAIGVATPVEICQTVFQLSANITVGNHFISVERQNSEIYLYVDGIERAKVYGGIPIPAQDIINPYTSSSINRYGGSALLTIGANKDGYNPLVGNFGDFRITNGKAVHVSAAQYPTTISSLFTDSTLGTRAQDINIVGGGFADSFSSHAPEELVPGQIFDTLDLRVYENATTSNSSPNLTPVLGFQIFKNTLDQGPIGSYTVTTSNTVANYSVPWFTANIDSVSVSINGNTQSSANFFISDGTIALSSLPPNQANLTIAATGTVNYYCIANLAVTMLVAPLLSTDTAISVANTAAFTTPNPSLPERGLIFINGERITYLYVNRSTNMFSGLVRGTLGTGVPNVHTANSQVISACPNQVLPGTPGNTVWCNQGANTAGNGNGLSSSNTAIATFLVSSGTTLP